MTGQIESFDRGFRPRPPRAHLSRLRRPTVSRPLMIQGITLHGPGCTCFTEDQATLQSGHPTLSLLQQPGFVFLLMSAP